MASKFERQANGLLDQIAVATALLAEVAATANQAAAAPRAPGGRQEAKKGRVRLTVAAAYLGYSRRTISRRVAEGVLTYASPPGQRGRGNIAFLWWDEVECLASKGPEACRELRRKMKRV